MSTSTSSARGPGREVLDDIATAQQYVLDLQVLFYSLKTVASNAQRAADATAKGSGAAPCTVDSNSKNARSHHSNPPDTSAAWQQQVEALAQQLDVERRERARLQEQFDQAAAMLRKSYGQIVDDYLFATEQLHERTRQLEGLMGSAAAGQPALAGLEECLGTSTNPSASVKLQGPWCSADSTTLHPPSVPSPTGTEPPNNNTRQATARPTSTPPATAYRAPDGGGGESCFANSRNAAAVAAAAGRDSVFLAPRKSSGGGHDSLATAVAGLHQDNMASQSTPGQASRLEQPGTDGDVHQQRWWGSGQAANTEPAGAAGAIIAASSARTAASSSALTKKILTATALKQAVMPREQDRYVAGGLEPPGRDAAAASATSPRSRHHSPPDKADRAASQQRAAPLPSHDGGAARRQRDELRQISYNLYNLQQKQKQGARVSTRAQQPPKDAAATPVYEDAALGCRPQATQWTVDSPTAAAAHQSPAASTFGADSDVSTPQLRPSPSVTSTTSPFSAAAARNPVSATPSLPPFRLSHDESQPREGPFNDAAASRQPVPDWSPSTAARSAVAAMTAAAAADPAVPGGALHGEGFRAVARERTGEATASGAVSNQQQQQQSDAQTVSASANRNATAILEAAGRSAQAAARAAAAKAARAAAGLSPQGQGRWSAASSQHPEEGRSSGRGEAAGGWQAGVNAYERGVGRTAGDGRPKGREGASQGPTDRGAASTVSPAAPGRSQSAKRLRRSASSPQERASPRSSTAGVSSRQDRAAAAQGAGAARELMSGRRGAAWLSARPVPPAEPPSTSVARAAWAAEQQALGSGAALARGRSLRYVQSVSGPEAAPEEASAAERLPDPLAAASCPAAAAAAPSRLDGGDIQRVELSSATAPVEVRSAAAASAEAAARGELHVASGVAKLDVSQAKIDVEAFLHHTRPRSPDAAAAHPAGSTSREHDRTSMPDTLGVGGHITLGAGFLRTEAPAGRMTTLGAAAVRNMATADTGAATVDDDDRRSARDESPGASSSSSLEGLASLVRGLRERLAGLQQEYHAGASEVNDDDDDDEGGGVEGGWQTDDDEELVDGVAAFASPFGDDDDDVDDDIDDGRNDNDGDNGAYAYDRAFSNSYTSSANNGALHYGAEEVGDMSPLAAAGPWSQKRGKGFGPYHNPYGSADSSASATPRAHSYAASPTGGHEPPRGLYQAGSSAGTCVGAGAAGAFSPRAARRGGCDGRPGGPSLLDTVNASTLGHAMGGGSHGSRNVSTGSSAAAAAAAPASSTRGPSPRGPAPADATTAAAWASGITAAWAGAGSAQHPQHDRVAPPDQTSPRKASLGGLSSRGGKAVPRWRDAEVGVEAETQPSGLAGDGGIHVGSASAAADKSAGLQGLRSEAMFARIKQQLDDLQNSFAQGLGMGAGRGGAAGGAGAGGGVQGQRAVHGEGEPHWHTSNAVGAGQGGGSGGGQAGDVGVRGDGSCGGAWRRSGVDGGPSVAVAGVALGAAEVVGSGAPERIEVGRREARTVGA